jgi:hypothetical protein
MPLTGIVDRTFDPDIDVRYAAQLSALGSLADDVIGDLVRARSGLGATSRSRAIAEASSLFESATKPVDASSALWSRSGLQDALRRMTATAGSAPSIGLVEGASIDFEDVKSALAAATSGTAEESQLTALRQFFGFVANVTMEAAIDAVRGRGPATSWSTI